MKKNYTLWEKFDLRPVWLRVKINRMESEPRSKILESMGCGTIYKDPLTERVTFKHIEVKKQHKSLRQTKKHNKRNHKDCINILLYEMRDKNET